MGTLTPRDYLAIPQFLEHMLCTHFWKIIAVGQKFSFQEPLNVEVNYCTFPFQITVGSARFVSENYYQMSKKQRQYIDELSEIARRLPGSILTRYLYSAGSSKPRYGELSVLEPPAQDMAGNNWQEGYSLRARQDDGRVILAPGA